MTRIHWANDARHGHAPRHTHDPRAVNCITCRGTTEWRMAYMLASMTDAERKAALKAWATARVRARMARLGIA